MKMRWRVSAIVVLGVVIASTTASVTQIGLTYQTWDFERQTLSFGILPSQVINPYGMPAAMIQDLSGTRLLGWVDGVWYGPEFKVFLDIPNQPLENHVKLLRVDLTYFGTVEFSWAADAVSGLHFAKLSETRGQAAGGWMTLSQLYAFSPNPREEIVVIGLKGFSTPTAVIPAAIESITVTTICAPEPATVAFLVMGLVLIGRRKISRLARRDPKNIGR